MGLVLNRLELAMRLLFVRRSLWQRLSARFFGMAVGATAVGSLMALWLAAP